MFGNWKCWSNLSALTTVCLYVFCFHRRVFLGMWKIILGFPPRKNVWLTLLQKKKIRLLTPGTEPRLSGHTAPSLVSILNELHRIFNLSIAFFTSVLSDICTNDYRINFSYVGQTEPFLKRPQNISRPLSTLGLPFVSIHHLQEELAGVASWPSNGILTSGPIFFHKFFAVNLSDTIKEKKNYKYMSYIWC
jgi:hypothetical protein